MFLCSGQQPALHLHALCGSWRQHHRSPNHSSSTKDRSIREKQHVWGGLHCDRSCDHGEPHRGNARQHGWDVKVFKPHSQGTTSVPGHSVRRTRGWPCWSQCLWPRFFTLGGSPVCQLRFCSRTCTTKPCFKTNCSLVFPC